MKFTLSWLKEYLDTNATLAEISERLTMIGLEVEHIHNPAEALKDFIVAEIREASPHPNASKLQICRVWDGSVERQIVCGAANARSGLKTVLAREGVFIPGSGIIIKKTKIRDVESNGMLCSAEELGLDAKSEGILELNPDAVPGSPAAEALGANDPVIEINITPNRADCLGVYGIARDLAAAGLGTLKALPLEGGGLGGGESIPVTLSTPACPLFLGCHIRGVKNAASPAWMQARLKAIGLRPISALVDITNYISYAYARPLHVYDADKLTGGITVRSARNGETLNALNDKQYTLSEGMTVIADDKGVLGLGGIVGGVESSCTEETRNVFLEAALFDAVNIAETGRKLEVLSDARTRFERGVDPEFTETGARLAIAMILELCGGEAGALVTAGAVPAWKREIAFNPARVESLGGVALGAQESLRILSSLGCSIQNGTVIPPSWRADIHGEADLVEEVLRIHGYGNIPATALPMRADFRLPEPEISQKRATVARHALAARGLMEAHTWSFLSRETAVKFGGGAEALTLVNPISAELDCMRPSLIPNLLDAAKRNFFRHARQVALFEVGPQFVSASPDGQMLAAAGIRAGSIPSHVYPDARFTTAARTPDAFDAKADCFAVLESLGLNTSSITVSREAPLWYHPGKSGALTLGKTVLGYFGELHPGVAAQFELEGSVSLFELFLNALPQPKAKAGKAKAAFRASDFQPVERDFAFVVKDAVSAQEVTRVVASADKQLIKAVELFDVYSGKGLEEGSKSMALRVTLQAPDRTLTEEEISAAAHRIIEGASKTLGATLRQ